MALDVWFKSDVVRILTAIAAAGEAHGPEYRQALRDVALAFGIVIEPPAPRRESGSAGWFLLDGEPGGDCG